jgi:PHP family Zn ribbon phosphoesterase
MNYAVDLHSHSGYAGGVGTISLATVANTMSKKGIHAFGVGDCLQAAWRETLETILEEKESGLFALADADAPLRAARFVMQTEVIFTSPVPSGGRKTTHTVLLFPGFAAADAAIRLLRKWSVKVNMGRPFIKCEDAADVAEKCFALRAIDPSVEITPAHVMTPQGVDGSANPVTHLRDVFGDFAEKITTVETGLSSDPARLARLPELDGLTLISNSDCHSEALNRVGREFTVLDVDAPSYAGIVESLRARRVRYTAEFDPAEGRFFLTGHRAGLERHGASYCYYSPDRTPSDGRCPICGKRLTVGVLERVLELSAAQAGDGQARTLGETASKQDYRTLVPLVEVIAAGLGVKNAGSRKVTAVFEKVLSQTGTEAALWEQPPEELRHLLRDAIPEKVLEAIIRVREGDFSFQPGYDGAYGGLRIGEKVNWFGQAAVLP